LTVRDLPERILLWTQVITGFEVDELTAVHVLDAATWHERRARPGKTRRLAGGVKRGARSRGLRRQRCQPATVSARGRPPASPEDANRNRSQIRADAITDRDLGAASVGPDAALRHQ